MNRYLFIIIDFVLNLSIVYRVVQILEVELNDLALISIFSIYVIKVLFWLASK